MMVSGALCLACNEHAPTRLAEPARQPQLKDQKMPKNEAEWKDKLSPEQYRVLREKGTERAFSGQYWDEKRQGKYVCAGCGQVLFQSADKYDSGSGWPSFVRPAEAAHVKTEKDGSLFMERTEVLCSRCGGHLGHVFDDGPKPTGLRYCINSAALALEPEPSD